MFDIFPLEIKGVLKGMVPRDIYNSLMGEIKEIEMYGSSDKWNGNLAGLLEKEYRLKKSTSSLRPFLIDMGREYGRVFNQDLESINGDLETGDIWVNFQKKNEYNPMHLHNGILSFVIWMKIPYKISDEQQLKNVENSKGKDAAASFEFTYTTIVGEMASHNIPVEDGWEGRIIMLPNKLMHQVYPFRTSDGYRISISGNLF